MNTCKNCDSEEQEGNDVCSICRFPLAGSEDEQAKYFAKQIIQKSAVADSIEKVKKARIILISLGAFYIVVTCLSIFNMGVNPDSIVNIVLGTVFIGFGLLTLSKPRIGLLIPLSLTVLYYLILLLTNPVMLYIGVLWKVIVLMGLGYGYFSVVKSNKILRENEYLASTLKLENNQS